MSRRVRLIVECEDALHRSFATRFLRGVGIPEGKDPEINIRNGKAGVLDHVAAQVRAVRETHAAAHLIVLVDGDNWKEERTLDEVNRRLAASNLVPLAPSDRVLLVVVGRRMDTWVRHLRGETVDEIDNPGHKLADDSVGRGAASVLAEHCRNRRPLDDPLPSLATVCGDWQAYCARHGL